MSDIIVKNGFVVTMDPKRPILVEGAIAVEDGRIADIGESNQITKQHTANLVFDAQGKVVMPGMINGHDHFEQSFMKGFVRVYPETTPKWVKEFKIPITREMNQEDYYLSSMISCLEMIRSGITAGVNSICQHDMKKLKGFGLAQASKAVEESGVRAVMPVSPADRFEPPDYLLSVEEAVDLVEWSISNWDRKAQGRERVWGGVGGVFSSTPKLWHAVKEVSDRHGVGFHTHIASAATGEVEEAYNNGNLGNSVTGAHCVWLSPREVEMMAKAGVRVVHCPTYKLSYAVDSQVERFGDGIAPITQMAEAGIPIGLGSDGCMGDTRDMFREMRNLAFTQHYKMRDKNLFPPAKLLAMATIDCARTMSWESEIGSLEVGKAADIIIINKDKPNMVPWTNPLASLVYLVGGSDVETVIVDGKVLLNAGEVKTVDEGRVLKQAQSVAARLIERAGFEKLMKKGYDPWWPGIRLPN
jgi:5-methylthioadenosine/S-adenosylhomocysteine deaminase